MFFRGCAATYDYGKIHGLGWGRAPELCYPINQLFEKATIIGKHEEPSTFVQQ